MAAEDDPEEEELVNWLRLKACEDWDCELSAVLMEETEPAFSAAAKQFTRYLVHSWVSWSRTSETRDPRDPRATRLE